MPWRLKALFSPSLLQAISDAVAKSEALHSGQIRVAVEGNIDLPDLLRGLSPAARARAVFAQLGVWDTAANNGVLIYLLLAERRVEIVADRAANAAVGQARWQAICDAMQPALARGDFEAGILNGVAAIGAELAQHFPPGESKNELPDAPSLF